MTPQLRLHFIVFLWGFTAILGKLITADAAGLVFYRLVFSMVCLYLFIRVIKKQSLKVSRKVLLQVLAVGVVIGLHWLFFFHSIKIANVSIALSCLSTATLFASILEPIVFKRKMDFTELLIGIVIVICIGLIFEAQFQYKWGIFWGVLCAFLSALFGVLNGKIFGIASSEKIIFYEMLGGTLVISAFILLGGDWHSVQQVSQRDVFLLVILAALFTAFPMLESIRLMEFMSPFTLTLAVNLEPVYGIILAFFIFGESERMSAVFYIASAVMILAIIANGLIKARRKKLT